MYGVVGPKNANGKFPITMKRGPGKSITIPCGKCVGCLLERSRQWSVRCVHESSLWDRNCFITLTYDSVNMPVNGSLDLRDVQLFMKRLRKKFGSCKKNPIRFFMCGEYGEKLGRPHYHALLFNHDFDDKILHTVRNDNNLYVSATLSELWPYGFASIGSVTPESAAYVARYVMKKVNGVVAPNDGKRKEFIVMSRRPGIGTGWFKEFGSDVYPSDEVIVNGASRKPPRFYDKMLEASDDIAFQNVKTERLCNALKYEVVHGREVEDSMNGPRLAVKEEVKRAQIGVLKRELED